jgi:hypothetical protein
MKEYGWSTGRNARLAALYLNLCMTISSLSEFISAINGLTGHPAKSFIGARIIHPSVFHVVQKMNIHDCTYTLEPYI